MIMSFPAAHDHLARRPSRAIADAYTTARRRSISSRWAAESAGRRRLRRWAASHRLRSHSTGTLFIGNRGGLHRRELHILLILRASPSCCAMGVIAWVTPRGHARHHRPLLLDPRHGPSSASSPAAPSSAPSSWPPTTPPAPMTPLGKAIFGVGAGLMTVLIRQFGGFPEGVTYGILIMNAFSPFLDKLRVQEVRLRAARQARQGGRKVKKDILKLGTDPGPLRGRGLRRPGPGLYGHGPTIDGPRGQAARALPEGPLP